MHGADVLEIGAGCGAVTRYLGETGAKVLALEGSERRAAIARSRCRDLENVIVVAEKLDQFECSRQFDVITLIGVLEYAPVYFPGTNPTLAFLKHVRRLLKPDGQLILAIENKLGLKYFSGAPEDHAGVAMYGIEGRYLNSGPRTFGKTELAGLLKDAGFANASFMAPFPDYKLPVSIITEAGFGCKTFDAGALAAQSVRCDPQLPGILAFSPELVWPALFENGIGLDLANSFLAVARMSAPDPEECPVLAWHFSTRRIREYCKETVFFLEGSGGRPAIRSRPIAGGSEFKRQDWVVRWRIPDSGEYIRGRSLSGFLVEIVTRDGWRMDDLVAAYKQYLAFIVSTAAVRGNPIAMRSADSEIPGCLFDLVPQNIMVDGEGGWHLFDQEWELREPLPVGWLLFRSMLSLIQSATRFGSCSDRIGATRSEFIGNIFSSLGLAASRTQIAGFAKSEVAIQEAIGGQACDPAQFPDPWLDGSLSLWNQGQWIDHQNRVIEYWRHVATEQAEQIAGLRHAAGALKEELDRISTSWAWRVAWPLRRVGLAILGALRACGCGRKG